MHTDLRIEKHKLFTFMGSTNFLKKWAIPPGFFNLIYKTKYHRLSKEEKIILSKNYIFFNRYQGKRCFVIGNGPSLNTQDLIPLKNELTFVMNAFWKNSILNEWLPNFYFFADPILFEGSPQMKSFFSKLNLRIDRTTFFMPLFGKLSNEINSLLPDAQTYYAAFAGSLSDGLGNKLDLTQTIPGVQSTSQFAIMAAMYMGCSPIYLIGMDHDWLAHRGQDRHFYQGKTIENHPVAHSDLNKYSYKSDLEAVLNLWKGYESIQKYADKNGIKIINATNGGYLDVFPRIEYGSIIN
jgi:hypothetical protein